MILVATLIFTFLLGISPSAATVYWAAHNGSNTATCSNIDSVGTADAPGTDPGSYGTIGRAAECATQAGDVVNIKNTGTYTGENHRINTMTGGNITSAGFKSGTSESVRTVVQGDPSGPRVFYQGDNWYCTNSGTERHWITIRHIKVDQGNQQACGGADSAARVSGQHVTIEDVEFYNVDNVGVYAGGNLTSGSTNAAFLTIRRSSIHDVGLDGNGYCLYATGDTLLFEYNECYNTRGEALQVYHNDWAPSNALIRYNYFHDIAQAFEATYSPKCAGVALKGPGHVVHDNIIYINTTSCPTATNIGYGIVISFISTSTLKAYNNLIINPQGHGIDIGTNTTGTHEIYNNIFWDITRSGTFAIDLTGVVATVLRTHNACVSAANCATANKTTIAALTDITVSSTNFRHKAGSAGIGVGRSVSTKSCNGTCDLGPFETFTATGGQASGNVGMAQANMSLYTPLITGSLGYTLKINSVSRTVTGVALSASSAISLTFEGAPCSAGQTITASYDSSVGTASDSALIGNTLNQPMFSFTDIPLTNNCAGAAYLLTQTAGNTYSAVGAQTTTSVITEVAQGGAFASRTKWKATSADPPALTTKLQYSITGVNGTYSDVLDSFGSGILRYVGQTTIEGMDLHGTAVSTERLTSEFSGMIDGAVVRCLSGCQVPAPDLTQDSESEQVDIVEVSSSATVGTIIWLRRVESDGTQMTYAGGSRPSIKVVAPSASGFAKANQPSGLSVTPNPMQAPAPFGGWLDTVRANSSFPSWLVANGLKSDERPNRSSKSRYVIR